MEELLNETVSQAELQKFEKNYKREVEEKGTQVAVQTQFEYAYCLVRSEYPADIKKGIFMLEDLAQKHSEGNRDYIYYLAIGNARIKHYSVALKFCKAFLQIEPNNQQAITLEEHIRKKMEKETMAGVAVAGGAALVLGGLVGLGLALASRNKSKDKH
ncbi:mitochondrial fission 1 protein [Contarinia nasturtii]|uniref:mitochondrial fission 1 protein n=1 Tax=Contarinia nasturtii TaxID=265458 RepID=UPI0012D37587|nr:mitochondrial fission 1 protein [Contarinia nasturtii]